ncbi:hypothetical protein BZA70DRAFT_270227 [Myxozyma melibiosi]|uniref:Uncharacterized protein n=1 Tax=Myxozyma melibiosi TaxID=54550 RepID=A0ABR1FB16_9ASCO
MSFSLSRAPGDWLPASARANWSARFKSSADSSSSDRNITVSLSRYSSHSRGNSRSVSPVLYASGDSDALERNQNGDADADADDDESFDRSSKKRRQRHLPFSILPARKRVTGIHQLIAAIVGVWLAIVVVLTCTDRVSADYDPLRLTIHNTKKLVSPLDSRLVYVGRWSRNKASGSASGLLASTFFQGGYVDVAFTGTSLGIHLGNFKEPVTVSVKIDDARSFTVVPYGREVISLAQNLSPSTRHVARVMFGGQAQRTDIEAFYVDMEATLVEVPKPKTKIIEIVQDTYNSSHLDALSWPYLVADSLGADRVFIPAPGMCISNCPDNIMALDKFYFLGSLAASRSMPKYWHFDQQPQPSLVILDIGTATKQLIDQKLMYRTLLPQDATKTYRDAVENYIRQIRKKAYKHVPIIILRPFKGALEIEMLTVAQNLRAAGDKNIHWVDTTAWALDTDDENTQQERKAAYLMQHVCSFLKPEEECDFLRPFEGRSTSKEDE